MTMRRRGACPGLSTPMRTGDGLLVRLLPTALIALDAFAELCGAARRHGNGTIEITARGSFQVRGLTPGSAPAFAAEVASLGIAASDGVPVLANALDDDPDALIDAAALAADLRRAIADAGLVLAPKVSVVVDGGGKLHLDAVPADVRLRAIADDGRSEEPLVLVAIAGDGSSATVLGTITPSEAVPTVLSLLQAIAAGGASARAADLLSPPPLAGEGQGGGPRREFHAVERAPSPTLPRKRGRGRSPAFSTTARGADRSPSAARRQRRGRRRIPLRPCERGNARRPRASRRVARRERGAACTGTRAAADRHCAGTRCRADGHRGSCGVHRRSGRSAAARCGMSRLSSMWIGAHRSPHTGCAACAIPCPCGQPGHFAHFRLCQGMRPSRGGGAHDRRHRARLRHHPRWHRAGVTPSLRRSG